MAVFSGRPSKFSLSTNLAQLIHWSRLKCLLAVTCIVLPASAIAQLPQIQLSSIHPTGIQRGATADVVVSGSDLDEASELLFSDPQVTATQKTDENGAVIPNTFRVTAAADASAGLHDVRVKGVFGISNPKLFRIDTIAEFIETEPNNAVPQAQAVALNTVVNARSNSAADVDVFRINVQAGQTAVIRVEAAVLASQMQPVLEVFDASGRRVASARRRRHLDPAIVYTSPEATSLQVNIRDAVYAGGNEYVYRLIIDDRPHVDFLSPAVLRMNQETKVTLIGRHLPGGTRIPQTVSGQPLFQKQVNVTLDAANTFRQGSGIAASSLTPALFSGIEANLLPVAIDVDESGGSEIEVASNDEPQRITPPVRLAGQFEKERDEDAYRFDAKQGQKWQIEVLAETIGSAAHPVLIVEQINIGQDGVESVKRLAREEVARQNPGGNELPSQNVDAAFLLTVPADGAYQVRLMDRFFASRGGVDQQYALLIRAVEPDFRVVLYDAQPSTDGQRLSTPGAISLRKGGALEIPVYAYRFGGHNHPIRILCKGLPKGLRMNDVVVSPGKNSALLVVSADTDAQVQTSTLNFVAECASTRQIKMTEIATLAHDSVNGLPRTGVLSHSLRVAVMDEVAPVAISTDITEATLSQDQQLLVPLKLTRANGFEGKVDLVFSGQPKNVDMPKISFAKGTDAAVARFYFKENADLGEANLVIRATATVPYRRNPEQVDRAKRRLQQIVEQIQSAKADLTKGQADVAAAEARMTELNAAVPKIEQQRVADNVRKDAAIKSLTIAVAAKSEAQQQLVKLRAKLSDATTARLASPTVAAEVASVQRAAAEISAVATAVAQHSAELRKLTEQVRTAEAKIIETMAKLDEVRTLQIEQQKVIASTKAQRSKIEALQKTIEAKKAPAEAAVKKAEAAAKAQNKNLRTIAVPIRLNVRPTPGKITASVPSGGKVKKSETIQVKVTVNRKNSFKGAVQVELELPDGEKRIVSDSIELAEAQSNGTLTLMGSADASPGEIVNAVIRATCQFQNRAASFDTPIKLTIVE